MRVYIAADAHYMLNFDGDAHFLYLQLFVTALAVALYVIPAIIIATCYTYIVCIIWTKSSIGSSGNKPKMSFRFTKKNSKLEVTCTIIYS